MPDHLVKAKIRHVVVLQATESRGYSQGLSSQKYASSMEQSQSPLLERHTCHLTAHKNTMYQINSVVEICCIL